jgi:hypothetical protein
MFEVTGSAVTGKLDRHAARYCDRTVASIAVLIIGNRNSVESISNLKHRVGAIADADATGSRTAHRSTAARDAARWRKLQSKPCGRIDLTTCAGPLGPRALRETLVGFVLKI